MTTRTVRDLFDGVMAARTVAEMRQVLDREVTYQAGQSEPTATALANMRYVVGYSTHRAAQVLAWQLIGDAAEAVTA